MDEKLFTLLQNYCEKIEKSNKIIDRKNIPNTGGVYFIKNKVNNIIEYIGKAKNLNRRINSDHISGEKKISTSTFRRKVSKNFNIKSGKDLRQYILENYDFYTIEIDDPDIRSLIEDLLIYKYRKVKHPLLND